VSVARQLGLEIINRSPPLHSHISDFASIFCTILQATAARKLAQGAVSVIALATALMRVRFLTCALACEQSNKISSDS
jgi:hypothetical protein